MELMKFKKRHPGKLLSEDFFNLDNFFDERMWKSGLMNADFWNGKTVEPALNIRETKDHFEIELAAPGFAKTDFTITIENGCLNIAAEKEVTEEDKSEDYTRREFNYSSFTRSLQLPESVREEDIEAKYNDGILNFRLNKKEIPQKKAAKVIEVG
ncbi:Hsp20/alpha crystallin family protein [Robiginitalea aurantiaca]|uniref:Hsp20/alpha crystallin family protein n=1 Tax=Robiginitalea aurantiaca TaxID=3056915 RepID=A0ABT7WH89_9FLAO|nr:Hsp20/alpha crystallin family protein [Robiginitalea aurantiaca]MDM9632285.1 Hsp20/alpha crystallin family protein [Robiginitalea aurantiaca]